MKLVPIAIALLALPACDGNDGPAENTAEQLEAAADHSTDAAAEVLENAADAIEGGNVADPGQAAQQALNRAGAAQVRGERPPGASQPIDYPDDGQ